MNRQQTDVPGQQKALPVFLVSMTQDLGGEHENFRRQTQNQPRKRPQGASLSGAFMSLTEQGSAGD